MSPKKTSAPGSQTEVFYHALYHHLAHWAAYVAMMGILISTGVLLCVTPIPTLANAKWRIAGIVIGVIVTTLAAFYFNKGMDTYGAVVNEMVGSDHIKRVQTTPHKLMIWSGFLSALACGAWDVFLVLYLD